MPRVFAAADIGSNTVHLLVAQVNGSGLVRLRNDSEWLSLGEIVAREGLIPANLSRRLISTLRTYKAEAASLRADSLYVFATEAMRLAANHDEIIGRIRDQLRLQVDLISPRREAELSLVGVQLDAGGTVPLALIEVGGGSVQVARCDEVNGMTDEISLPIGTGRLMVEAELTHPSTDAQVERLDHLIHDAIEPCRALEPVKRIVASGGVARGLWRALHPDGDQTMAIQELEYLRWAAARLDEDEICKRFGVKTKRAQTLLAGSSLFIHLLKALGLPEMMISEFGVREGAILEMAKGRLEPCRV